MIESVTSWLTPTVLFCFLNLMIGTIFITSNLKTEKKQHQLGSEDSVPQLTRSSSVLHRVKTFNFSFPNPFSETNSPQIQHNPSLLQRIKSINLSFSRLEKQGPVPSVAQYVEPYDEQTQELDEQHIAEAEEAHNLESHVTRSKSATACVETSRKVPTKTMVKYASEKQMVVAEEEEAEYVDRRRPATTREMTSFGEDEAVDEKANDFINMFRNQLKLQRLDSIIRYKEMLNRGARR